MTSGDMVKRIAGWMAVGLDGLLRSRARTRLGILVYHRTSPIVPGVPAPEINVTPERFREQLVGLRKRGFTYLSLRDALAINESDTPWPKKSLVVTFDDGYESNYLFAWPVLRELHIPATIFLNTAYLDSDEPFPFDPWANQHQSKIPPAAYRPLRDEQCQEMLADGLIELGAHTHTHADFRCKPEQLSSDLETCVTELQRRFGVQGATFAFPFGRVALGYAGGALTEASRDVGVSCALTTECELIEQGSDPYHWGRFNTYDWDSSRTLAAKLAGWYGWAPKLHERITQRSNAESPQGVAHLLQDGDNAAK